MSDQTRQASVGEILTDEGIAKATAFVNAYRDGTLKRDKEYPTLAHQFRAEVVAGNLKDPEAADEMFVAYALLAAFDIDHYKSLWEAAAVPSVRKLKAGDKAQGGGQ